MDGSSLASLGTIALYAATFAFAFVSGIVPFVLNIEVYLLAVAALAGEPWAAVVGLAAAGQTAAKLVLYLVGKGALNITWVRKSASSKAAEAFARKPGSGLSIAAGSAVIGVPPLYAVSLVAGALRLPMAGFTAVVFAGLLTRFAAVYLVPGLFR